MAEPIEATAPKIADGTAVQGDTDEADTAAVAGEETDETAKPKRRGWWQKGRLF